MDNDDDAQNNGSFSIHHKNIDHINHQEVANENS